MTSALAVKILTLEAFESNHFNSNVQICIQIRNIYVLIAILDFYCNSMYPNRCKYYQKEIFALKT